MLKKRFSLTQICHDKLSQNLHSGDWVIDATAGNGHDTLFLAQQVMPGGRVFAFDVQQQAINNTRNRLDAAGYQQGIELFCTGHESMKQHVDAVGHIKLIMFNLGYLPSADKTRITQPDTTVSALDQSLELLKPGGMLSIMAYPGHAGGKEETSAVLAWCARLEQAVFIERGNKENSPVFIYVAC